MEVSWGAVGRGLWAAVAGTAVTDERVEGTALRGTAVTEESLVGAVL